MKRLPLFIVACFVLFLGVLASCATFSPPPSDFARQVDYGCATAASALTALTAANKAGKLTADQQRGILAASRVTTPICTAPTRPTLTEVELKLFLSAIAMLSTRLQGLKE